MIEELENNSEYVQKVFINALWGIGKTYFVKSLEDLISYKNLSIRNSKSREIKFIIINVRETDYFSDPVKSIIGKIVENISLSNNVMEKVGELKVFIMLNPNHYMMK